MASNTSKLNNNILLKRNNNLADKCLLGQALDSLVKRSTTMPLYVLYKHIRLMQKEFKWAKIDVNYRSNASMAFAPREIDSIFYKKNNEKCIVYVVINFLGFQSVESPLPLNDHERLVQDVNEDKLEIDQFYNFFNHRLIEMLIETRLKYDYIHNIKSNLSDRTSKVWTSLAGIYTEVTNNKGGSIFHKMMQSSSLLFGKSISNSNIAAILQHYFEFNDVRIENYTPRVVELKTQNRSILGIQNKEIGDTFILGRFKSDIANSCRIHIYLDSAYAFLPDTAGHDELNSVLKWLLPSYLIFTISLHLNKNIPPVIGTEPIYLGWTMMLASSEKGQVINL